MATSSVKVYYGNYRIGQRVVLSGQSVRVVSIDRDGQGPSFLNVKPWRWYNTLLHPVTRGWVNRGR